MPLDSSARSALQAGIFSAFALGVTPPPFNASSSVISLAIAAAYNTYVFNAVACSGSPPTLVQYAALKSKLQAALSGQNTAEDAAEKWHEAFEAFWTGAQFGATGTVVTIGGGAIFERKLADIFSNEQNTMLLASQQIAVELESYTKTVMVKDSAIPSPSGCGPSPIS